MTFFNVRRWAAPAFLLLASALFASALAAPRQSEKPPHDAYNETVKRGDDLLAAGNSFEAVLAYERAARIAYNNKLKTDVKALDERLARARRARDSSDAWPVLELTTPQAASVHAMKGSDICHPTVCVDGGGEDDRWLVTNPYLPRDRSFLSMIYGTACSADGTLYVAGNGVVSAAEAKRIPRANLEWYADNGHGIWRVAPDGRITAFSVGPYGHYPANQQGKWKGACNVKVAEAASFGPDRWGGIAVDRNGGVFVSDTEHHMVLELRADGTVRHVAGGGPNACAYDPWKDKTESGYRDGPGIQALFRSPRGLAFDRDGNLLVADFDDCALRRIDPSGNVTTAQRGCHTDPVAQAKGDMQKRINHVFVVVDPENRPVVGGSVVIPGVNVYSNVHRVHPDGHVEQLISARKGYANGGQLLIEFLAGLAYLPDGRLLLADDPNNLLRAFDGMRLTDWLGLQGERGEKDINGPAGVASLRRPGGLCVTGDGTVFVAPARPRSGPVRKVDGKTRAVSTWVY